MSKIDIIGTAVNKLMEFLSRGKAGTGFLIWCCPIVFISIMVFIFGDWSTDEKMGHINIALDSFYPYFLGAIVTVAIGMVGPKVAGQVAEALASLRRKK